MRRAMTCVYCEPKSRITTLEWVDASVIFTRVTGEFVGRHALRPDRLEIALTGQAFPDQSPRARTALALLACCVLQVDRHNRPQQGMRSRPGSACVSSTYFMKRLFHCKKVAAFRG